MIPTARAHLAQLALVSHGGVADAELQALGLSRDQIVDFAVNTNPLGPSPAALDAARRAVWSHYPDDHATVLRQALAERNQVDEPAVVVGNGSSELIWLLALAYLDPGDAALIIGPTFGEYARAVRVVNGAVHEYRADAVTGFAVDLDAVGERALRNNARLLFLCNPNNPTGTLLSASQLAALAHALPRTLVVVDEAYRPFVDDPPATRPLLDRGNVVLLRSLTKDYALAGLRLGYTLAPVEVCCALDRVRPPWSVNAIAQAAGLAAIADEAHLARARAEVRVAREYLTTSLGALGIRVVPSTANYLLVEVGNSREVRAQLLRRGIGVRDCTSFGLSGYVRVGVRPLADCQRLVAAFLSLARNVGSGKPSES